jgi:hypothetical protein
MIAFKLWMLVLGIGLFAVAAAVVAYDVYAATRLYWLLQQPAFSRPNRPTAPPRPVTAIAIFGEPAKARAASRNRRPKPLWVARFASQEHRS